MTTTIHPGWTMTPNDIIRRADISPTAKTVWLVIASFTNPDNPDIAWPGQQRIAEMVGVSVRTVYTCIKELVEKGLLEVKRRGLGLTNLYRLLTMPARKHTSDQERKQAASTDRQPAATNQESEEESININVDVGELSEVAEMLKSVGVNNPTRDRLLKRYTPAHIRAWVLYWQEENRRGKRLGVGLLINWIRSESAPKVREAQEKPPERTEIDEDQYTVAIELAKGITSGADQVRALASRIMWLLEAGYQPEEIPDSFDAIDALLRTV